VAPTREEITTAYQSALQGRAPAAAAPAAAVPAAAAPVAAAPVVAPPSRKLDPDELAALMKRAKDLIAIGDIASARLLLERAADAQEASAALLLAQTYDPAVLGAQDMRSITPDPAAARTWYQKAAQLGSPDATQRLAQMQK
jgi:TPR repeat protein